MTIFEVLKNAQYNLNHSGPLGLPFAKEQLNNALLLLEVGYNLDDEFDEDEVDNLKEV